MPEDKFFVALYETAKVVNSSLKLDQVLARIVEQAAHVLGAQASSIRLLNRAGDQLLIRAAYGLSEGYLHKGPVLLEKSEVDRETLNGRPVYVCDMADDQRIQYREEARLEGLCSLLCVPLKAHETVIGVLRVYAADRHEFSEPEIHLAQALADLGALAIQNAREHEQLETDYQYLVNYVQGVTA